MNPSIYLVGGAVRDQLLNRPSSDKDYVVVGASPEWMLQQGFKPPVGNFPVYLHPQTGEEYALARQERKIGRGYNGFAVEYDPSVTLEDDLMRRDLTINSMAMDEDGNIIDPYGGQHDLEQGILRHTSEAFADDPLRVLRLARFAARYDFKIAPDTIKLASKLVESGELNDLPKERIWTELMKGIVEPNPAVMIRVLHEVGALDTPPVQEYFPIEVMTFVPWFDNIFFQMIEGKVDLEPEVKFLMIMGHVAEEHGKDYEKFARRLCIPAQYSRMATKRCFLEEMLMRPRMIKPEEVLKIVEETKYVQECENDDYKHVIKTLQIEEWYSAFKTQFSDNLKLLNDAVHYIKQIDMRAVTAGDKSTVKSRVTEAKFEAIKRAFEILESI